MSSPPSETDLARTFAHPFPEETLPQLLHRALRRVQSVRAAAYTKLNHALRPPPTAAAAPPPDYATICAHVTEDLKLASEAVIELRAVVAAWHSDKERPSAHEIRGAVRWLDSLQRLEERKLVATVSLHALQRSARIGIAADVRPGRISEFAKELNTVDEEINELLQEIREYCLENNVGDGG